MIEGEDESGFSVLRIIITILCILGVVAGATYIGKGSKIACEIGSLFNSCPEMPDSVSETFDSVYEIQVRHSGKCLDVEWGSQADSVSANQFYCHGGPNQQWRFVEMS